MRIEHDFEYDAYWQEIADEYIAHDSEYQANFLNSVGTQFKMWSQDKTKTFTHIQLLEIAEQLNDNGKWFINILYDFMGELNLIEGKELKKWIVKQKVEE